MENNNSILNIRLVILSGALLAIIGVSGLIYTGNFSYPEALVSNTTLIIVALAFLVFSVYLLSRYEIRSYFKKMFLERSEEATLKFVRDELRKIKNYLDRIQKVNTKNANKILKDLKTTIEKLSPYKVYLSSIFVEGKFLENINKISSYKRINSKLLPEFSLIIKELKEELKNL